MFDSRVPSTAQNYCVTYIYLSFIMTCHIEYIWNRVAGRSISLCCDCPNINSGGERERACALCIYYVKSQRYYG